MPVEKFTVSRDDTIYECFPSLTLCESGRIMLVYRESDGHVPKNFCRLVVRVSDDNGNSFSGRTLLIESETRGGRITQYNCPKVQQLADGRILIICDAFPNPPGERKRDWSCSHILLWYSADDGESWSVPVDSGVRGIMPDEVLELDEKTWLLATQFVDPGTDNLTQCASRSSDRGETWQPPAVVAAREGYDFCEASILELPGKELVCYMRENSNLGRPIYKCISDDRGETWRGPYETQMDGGHRPVAHLTRSGKVLITYRHQIGGASPGRKNLFAFLESPRSAAEPERNKQSGVLLPLDHDRNPDPDGGYTGWVEIEPGSFLAVNYIKDDAPMAQIRGYRFGEGDF